MRIHLVFHGVGDDIAARQGVKHAGVTHGDAVVDGHRVELTGDAAGLLDGFGNQSADLVQVHMARQELVEGVGNGDDRLAKVLAVHAGGTVEGACAREYSSIHQFCRSHFHAFYCAGRTGHAFCQESLCGIFISVTFPGRQGGSECPVWGLRPSSCASILTRLEKKLRAYLMIGR